MDLGDLNGGHRTVMIAGEAVSVSSSANIKKTLKNELEQRGLDSFIIVINGDEITDSNDIPETFGEVQSVEVNRYVKAGR